MVIFLFLSVSVSKVVYLILIVFSWFFSQDIHYVNVITRHGSLREEIFIDFLLWAISIFSSPAALPKWNKVRGLFEKKLRLTSSKRTWFIVTFMYKINGVKWHKVYVGILLLLHFTANACSALLYSAELNIIERIKSLSLD